MRRFMILLVVLTGCVGLIEANTSVPSTLPAPPLDTYLRTSSRLINPDDQEHTEVRRLVEVLSGEFLLRYEDEASVVDLQRAYRTFYYGRSNWSNYHPYLDIPDWHIRIVSRWLENNPQTIAADDSVQFDDYTLSFSELDIQAGIDTWLVSVMKGDPQRDYYGYGHYWLARRNSDIPAGYEFELLPVPDRILQLWPAQAGNYPVSLVNREDINNDGLPELIFRTSSVVPSGSSTGSYRHVYVIGWQNGEPVRLLWDSVITEDQYPWQENNIDDDPAEEIVRRIRYQNNWLCYRDEDVIYDWTGTTYEYLETVSHYENSVECAVSQAEEAMHDKNYPAAIEHYREARERYGLLRDPEQREWLSGWEGFASERLPIAMAFNGELDAAFEFIQFINRQPQPENTIAHALGQRITRNSSLLEICQVANQAVSDFPHGENYRGIPYFNRYVDENFRTEMSMEHPGCSVHDAVPVTVSQMEFPVGENPMTLLARRGLDGESETGDYNSDGIDDWFIWVDPGSYDYLLMSGDEDMYRVYSPGVNSRDWYDAVRPVMLPDGTTRAVMLVRSASDYLCGEDIPCEPDRVPDTPEYQDTYQLTLIYVENGDKVRRQIRVPADYYRSEMTVLPDEWQLVRGIMRTYRGTYNGIQAHVWDDDSMDYVLKNPPLLPEDTDWRDRPPLPFDDEMRALLYETRDYDAVIQRIDEALQMPDPPQELQLRYYRAVALHQTGQTESARDAYRAIYRDAPNSVWGTLSQWYTHE